jgi:hypothetical protein
MTKLFTFIAGLLCFSGNAFSQATIGLLQTTSAATESYMLLAPNPSLNTYLVDHCGREVHRWTSSFQPGNAVYLTPDGRLLRTCRVTNPNFPAGGSGGRVEILDWDSNILWEYDLSDANQQQHHDAILLPNGNVLALLWYRYSANDAIAAGRNPASVGNFLWSEKIIEIQPSGTNGGTVVWEWDLWDHIIQDFDSTRNNFGIVPDHPELMNLNFYDPTPGPVGFADWLHANAIAYNEVLDQIVISAKFTNEFYIIDHSTTTTEAAAHSGGRWGKGGDFLYRWGNPASYGRGTAADQTLFGQHNVHWIAQGCPDEGKLILFNNGHDRPTGAYSSVEIISPPVDTSGAYLVPSNQPFGPQIADWIWTANPPTSFYSQLISGAEQLPNGNIVACAGQSGRILELNPSGQPVWEYINPVVATGPLSQGSTPANNAIFRAPKYLPSYPGLAGRALNPGNPIELNPLTLPASCLSTSLEFERPRKLSVFPNPAQHVLQMKTMGDESGTWEIVDMTGRNLLRGEFLHGNATFNISHLPAGIYGLKATGFGTVLWVKP